MIALQKCVGMHKGFLCSSAAVQQTASRPAKTGSDGACIPLSSALWRLTLQSHSPQTTNSESSDPFSTSNSASSLSSNSSPSESD